MFDDWPPSGGPEHAEAARRAQQALRDVCQKLDALGVQTVTVTYDGVGDSGAVEDIAFEPAPAGGVPDALRAAIEEFAYEALPGGWEINEGAFGALTLHVRERRLRREHSWRVTTTEEEEEELDL